MDAKNTKADGPRVFHYHGTVPPALALLLVAPLLLIFLSFAAVLMAGGTVAALVLPLFLRRRLRRAQQDPDVITLERDQFSRLEHDAPQQPPH